MQRVAVVLTMQERAAALGLALVVTGSVGLGGCAPVTATPVPTRPPAVAPPAPTAPALPNDLKWVRDAAEYQAAVLQAYRGAADRVESQAAGRARHSWAVVLDADETVISNLAYQLERGRAGLGFTAESWNAWVRRQEATPLPGAAAFLARVRALGGRIAIVTNRLGSECADTEKVFGSHALVYDVILCRPDGSPSDKNPRFEAVRSGRAFGLTSPVEVVVYLGDNIHDFPGLSQDTKAAGPAAFEEFGVRFFLVPNPMYGGWQ